MRRLFLNVKIQPVLAIIVVMGGLFLIYLGNVDSSDKIGLFGIIGLVLNFYFGSSKSSTTKDQTISDLTKNNDK